jgi:hypothetical protein
LFFVYSKFYYYLYDIKYRPVRFAFFQVVVCHCMEPVECEKEHTKTVAQEKLPPPSASAFFSTANSSSSSLQASVAASFCQGWFYASFSTANSSSTH